MSNITQNEPHAMTDWPLKNNADMAQQSTYVPINSSLRMTGSIAVGVVFIGGEGDLEFEQSELVTVRNQIDTALSSLHKQGGTNANINFIATHNYTWVNTDNPTNPTIEHDNDLRSTALRKLGFNNVSSYIEHIRENAQSQWAYVAFITKYNLHYFAYECSNGSLSINYENGSMGPNHLSYSFEFLTCIIFGAENEAARSQCTNANSGYYQVPNNNCVNHNNDPDSCLMLGNTTKLCRWSRGQVGWSYWSKGNKPGFASNRGGNMAALNDDLYLVYMGSDNGIYISVLNNDSGQWSGGVRINSKDKTRSVPRITSLGGKLYVAFRGHSTNKIFISGTNDPMGGNWPGAEAINDNDRTVHGPSIASLNGILYVSFRGEKTNHIYISSSNSPMSGNWPHAVRINNHDKTENAPIIEFYQRKLYLAYTGLEGHIYLTGSDDPMSGSWPHGVRNNSHDEATTEELFVFSINSSPDLASFNNRLYLSFKNGTHLYVNSSDNPLDGDWPASEKTGKKSSFVPSIAALGSTMYMTYNDNDDHNKVVISNSKVPTTIDW